MDGAQNTYSALFASADFSDNDAGAGSASEKIEAMPEYRDIKVVIENLIQATMNMMEDGISKKTILEHKNNLKRLMCVENLGLLESFLKPVEENDSYNKILQISETLANEMFNPYNKGVFEFLKIDTSGNTIDFENTIGMHSDIFSTALDNLNMAYRDSLQKLFSADSDIRNAINTVQKILNQVAIVANLETNETTIELLESLAKYVHKSIDNIKLYDLFNKFINARKTFVAYRNLLQIKTATEGVESEPMCSICMAEPIKQVAVPCGHSFCNTCISKQVSCYICRCKIEKKIRLFLN